MPADDVVVVHNPPVEVKGSRLRKGDEVSASSGVDQKGFVTWLEDHVRLSWSPGLHCVREQS